MGRRKNQTVAMTVRVPVMVQLTVVPKGRGDNSFVEVRKVKVVPPAIDPQQFLDQLSDKEWLELNRLYEELYGRSE